MLPRSLPLLFAAPGLGLVVVLALVLAPPGRARAEPPARAAGALVRPLGKAVVDWGEGVVSARGVAAADLRFPGVAVRDASVREARRRAAADLRAALPRLTLRGTRRLGAAAAEQALERAQAIDVQYESNGGARLVLAVRFQDLAPPREAAAPAPRELTLVVPTMPFEVAPVLLVRGKEAALAGAVYRQGPPPRGAEVTRVRRDPRGRLVLPGKTAAAADLVGARAVIYLRRVPRR